MMSLALNIYLYIFTRRFEDDIESHRTKFGVNELEERQFIVHFDVAEVLHIRNIIKTLSTYYMFITSIQSETLE